MNGHVGDVLVDEESIRNRVSELAAEITRDYADRDLLVVGVLKGAAFFATDLVRRIEHRRLEMDWTTISSYGAGTRTSGVVRMLADTAIPVRDRDVLLVDDVCDSGLTLQWMKRHLVHKGARSVEAAVAVTKPLEGRHTDQARYVGFELGDHFLVGYGMDLDQHFRQLRSIHALEAVAP